MPTPKKVPVPGGAPHARAKKENAQAVIEMVIEKSDDIIARYVGGESLTKIAATLPLAIKPEYLREILALNPATADKYKMCGVNRAHSLVEEALDMARAASLIGDAAGYRVATDTFMKVAAKLAPAEYGDKSKVELTGKDGGPLEVKADMTLSPADAYERLIGKP